MKNVLSLIWRGWKKFAHGLGIVNTKILLSVAYFIIIAIGSIFGRLFGADLLDRRMKPKDTYWHDREQLDISLDDCKRQF